jgi:hypothetical protein
MFKSELAAARYIGMNPVKNLHQGKKEMKVCKVIAMLVLSVMLCSCAGQLKTTTPVQDEYAGINRIEGASIESVQKESRVTSGYENIVLNPIQMSPQFATDYPKMKSEFQSSLLGYLKDKHVYQSVEDRLKDTKLKKRTMIVDTKVIDMRIVGTHARMWGGFMAGSSHADIYLKLTDATSQNVLLERVIGTSYNAFASEFAFGSEHSLPMDMGQIIGEYICTVAPVK